MKYFILLTIYLLMILGVIFIENKEPYEALLWVIILMCIPYLGMVLYLVFGSTVGIKVTRKVSTYRLDKQFRDDFLNQKQDKSSLSQHKNPNSKVVVFNQRYNNTPLTYFESHEIYIDGKTHYENLFKDIREAKRSIHIEFYTIHNDEIGHKLIEELALKASQGLEVWLMCDYIANIMSPPKMFKPLKLAGGKFKRIKAYVTHFRGHRKIVAIDGSIGYIGGMNIGKKYLGVDKVKTPWRDTQIRLTGKCVGQLENYFLLDWVCTLSKTEILNLSHTYRNVDQPDEEKSIFPCQFVIGGVDDDKESIKMSYLSMIRQAKNVIHIQSPYFIPDTSILDALKTAAASGVKIEIMIPNVKSSFFLDPVTRYYSGQLLSFDAKIYKYNGYIHAKTMVIDDKICCIGSVNMDIRSLTVDDEICGMFYDPKVVCEYTKIFKKDIKNCTEYCKQNFEERKIFERISERFYLIFAPLM